MSPKGEPKSDAGQDAARKKLRLLSSPKFRGRLILSSNQKDCPTIQVLAAYVEGRLSWFERRRCERHLNRCPACLHILSRTYKEELDASPAVSRKSVEERSFLLSILPTRGNPLLATAVAALLVLFAVGSLQVYRHRAGPGTDSIQVWNPGKIDFFLHSSFIEKESLRSTVPGSGSRDKKVTPKDLLRVDFPFNQALRHWGFLFFAEQGNYINGLSMDRIGSGREYDLRLLRGGPANPSVDVLDDMGLLEVGAADLLGAFFGRITMVAISTGGQVDEKTYRDLAHDLQQTLSMEGSKTGDALRKGLTARFEEIPFIVGIDDILYLRLQDTH